MKPPICFDIDNVIARTDEVMREVIRSCSEQGVDLSYEDILEFDYWKDTDRLGRRFDKSEWTRIHNEFTRNHLHRIRPYDNVQAYLARLAERFEIQVATSRLREGHEATINWLQIHQVPYTRIHFVSHGKKHEIPERFTAAVEDDRGQARLFHDCGVRAFLLAHPWNTTQPPLTARRRSVSKPSAMTNSTEQPVQRPWRSSLRIGRGSITAPSHSIRTISR